MLYVMCLAHIMDLVDWLSTVCRRESDIAGGYKGEAPGIAYPPPQSSPYSSTTHGMVSTPTYLLSQTIQELVLGEGCSKQ